MKNMKDVEIPFFSLGDKQPRDMSVKELAYAHELCAWTKSKPFPVPHLAEYMAELSRAFDQKCEEAGIRINIKGNIEFDKYGTVTSGATKEIYVQVPILAEDLHALIGHLIRKLGR